MKFITPRASRILLILFAAVLAKGQADLRGIWQAQSNAYKNLESAGAIVDPPDGKIPYQPGKRPTKGPSKDEDPSEKCFQAGVPRATYLPTPFQISQNDAGVYIIYQDVHTYRVIHLDRTAHDQGLEYAMGDSRGRWEGRTLVVDVTSFSPTTWLDGAGNNHSDALHVVERYTRADANTITYEATIEDPKTFTKPWKIRIPLRLQPASTQIIEDECEATPQGRRHASPFKSRK